MTPWLEWLVGHEARSIAIHALIVVCAVAVLRQRRPSGSAFAWLLVIVLVPYVGIPLYLVFGGRKFRARAERKKRLRLAGAGTGGVSALGQSTTVSRVSWLEDGVVAYETFLREIKSAERSIRIVTFVVSDDATGRSLLEALVERAAAGVDVRLLLDDLLRFHAPKDVLRRLVAAGGRVERFMPLIHFPLRGQDNLRNHRKIALFDCERAIVGGMNLANEYMGPSPAPERWRDLSTLVEGAAVQALDAIFCADWEFASGETLSPAPRSAEPGTAPLRVIPSGPDSASDPIYDALLTAVFRAEKRFWVSTPYFVPDEPLLHALSIAAARGVDVRVVVPERSNHRLADLARVTCLSDLGHAGARVFRLPTMLHAKALLVDETLAVVGSANFDMRSLFLDYEIALFFTGPEEIATLDAWFTATCSASVEGVPRASALRAGIGDVARLVAPLL